MTNHVFEKDGSWFFIDETQSHSYGPFWDEEEAKQEMELYNSIELEGTIKKIESPSISKNEYWYYYDGPLIGTIDDKLYCFWDSVNNCSRYLLFWPSKENLELIKDFFENGYNKHKDSSPILTYILRTEKPIAWFELS